MTLFRSLANYSRPINLHFNASQFPCLHITFVTVLLLVSLTKCGWVVNNNHHHVSMVLTLIKHKFLWRSRILCIPRYAFPINKYFSWKAFVRQPSLNPLIANSFMLMMTVVQKPINFMTKTKRSEFAFVCGMLCNVCSCVTCCIACWLLKIFCFICCSEPLFMVACGEEEKSLKSMNSWQSVIVMWGKRRECGANCDSLIAKVFSLQSRDETIN